MTSLGSISAMRLENTVGVLSASIATELDAHEGGDWSEYLMRRELVSCILGSQVRYESALSALGSLETAGLLSDAVWLGGEASSFEAALFVVLSGGCCYGQGSYRFPSARAKQLAGARRALAEVSLGQRLKGCGDARKLRRSLVADVPGLGPKQASMFLRNVGASYDLAILDTHVVRFATTVRLVDSDDVRIAGLPAYERLENVLVRYAERLGFPVGCVDLAIWATMRAVRELET